MKNKFKKKLQKKLRYVQRRYTEELSKEKSNFKNLNIWGETQE